MDRIYAEVKVVRHPFSSYELKVFFNAIRFTCLMAYGIKQVLIVYVIFILSSA